MPKDYYLILGIPSDATMGDIKLAYRRLAKEFHPDRYGSGQSPFLAIQEAYSVLSDPVKRQGHDQEVRRRADKVLRAERPALRPGVEPLIPEPPPLAPGKGPSPARTIHSFNSFLDQLFDRRLAGMGAVYSQGKHPLEKMTIEVSLSPEQAFYGGQVRVLLPFEVRCPSCWERAWPLAYPCWRCGGEGVLVTEYPVMISYPPGVADGHQVGLRLKAPGREGGHRLIVHFKVAGH